MMRACAMNLLNQYHDCIEYIFIQYENAKIHHSCIKLNCMLHVLLLRIYMTIVSIHIFSAISYSQIKIHIIRNKKLYILIQCQFSMCLNLQCLLDIYPLYLRNDQKLKKNTFLGTVTYGLRVQMLSIVSYNMLS